MYLHSILNTINKLHIIFLIIISELLFFIIILIYFILDFYYNYINIEYHLFFRDRSLKKDYELIVKNLMNATIHEKRIKDIKNVLNELIKINDLKKLKDSFFIIFIKELYYLFYKSLKNDLFS